MTKKFLSMVLSAVVAFGAAGSLAFAEEAPETIIAPNGEVIEIPTVEAPAAADDEEGQTYQIKSMDDFNAITWDEWWASGDNVFEIYCDLDFSNTALPEWSGIIEYFQGHIVGMKNSENDKYPVISGIPTNCAFIYGNMGGTIENLTFDHGSNAANISLYPVSGGDNPSITLKNITVNGNITLTGADQSNYSPFIYSAGNGDFTMDNCVNNATIDGDIYGGIFYGYYAMYPAHTYTFKNCVNNADVTMTYAGMFFGNDSDLNGRLNEMTLSISGCENNATIRGTERAAYLAAPVTNAFTAGSNANSVEQILEGNENATLSISPITKGVNGQLAAGKQLQDFTGSWNGYDISFTRPTDESQISYYTVGVGAYVNLWYLGTDEVPGRFYGSAPYYITEKITKESLSDEEKTVSPSIKAYGLADSEAGTKTQLTMFGHQIATYNGEYYYQLSNADENEDFAYYVSDELKNGKPDPIGLEPAQYVVISAYGASGNLIDSFRVVKGAE